MRRAAEQGQPSPSAAARFRKQQADRQKRDRMRTALFAWTGAATALAASGAGAVAFRQDVAEVWPRSASAFAVLGFDVNVYGLEMDDLMVERSFEGATPVLVVSGEVRNIGREEKAAPPLRVTLRDPHANPLYEVVYSIHDGAIAPGQSAPFQVRLENPPLEAVDLEATFAPDAHATAINASQPALELRNEDALHDGPTISEDPGLDEPHDGATHAPGHSDLRSTLSPQAVMEGYG